MNDREAVEHLESLGAIVTSKQENQQCDFCGKIAELRPYGPNGETICFQCMMKDEESAKKKFLERFDYGTQ
jgi:hypothetical protein